MHAGRVVLIAMLLLGACGMDSAHGGSANEQAFRDAIVSYTNAFANGDAAGAWAQVSQRCKKQIAESFYRATAGQGVPGLTATNIRIEVGGNLGRASYETGVAGIGPYFQQPWRFEDGQWHWDACPRY